MASIFQRRNTWWVKFRHPATGLRIRESLETHDQARAELLRQRVELESALLDPRFQAAELPAALLTVLGMAQKVQSPPEAAAALPIAEQTPAPTAPVKRVLLDDALKAYLDFVRTENAARHVGNKLSMLRRFLGTERTEQFSGEDAPALRQRRLQNCIRPFFRGEFLDELTIEVVRNFFGQLDLSKKTKRHYREFFHHFFEFCIRFEYYRPQNWHCPNPTAALPSYVSKNRRIVFLSNAEVEAQLEILKPFPAFRIAAALMLYAGLRRAEAIWLTRDAISPDLSFLSVVNRVDERMDIESSLKTGERAVTILPPLQKILAEYLLELKERWLVCKPSGGRWNADAFGKKLRAINCDSGLKWTCLHYRHTYATQRAAEGWPLFRIAKEMGNTVAVVEEYYAGFIRPVIEKVPCHESQTVSAAVA